MWKLQMLSQFFLLRTLGLNTWIPWLRQWTMCQYLVVKPSTISTSFVWTCHGLMCTINILKKELREVMKYSWSRLFDTCVGSVHMDCVLCEPWRLLLVFSSKYLFFKLKLHCPISVGRISFRVFFFKECWQMMLFQNRKHTKMHAHGWWNLRQCLDPDNNSFWKF